MRTAWRRGLVAAGAVVLIAAGLGYAFQPRPVPADLATVDRGQLLVTVDEEGRTRVRDVYVVSTPVAGRVLRIQAEAGDVVEAGQTRLATVEPSEPSFLDIRRRRQAEAEIKAAEATLSLANAELARAQAELDFARSDLARAQPLAARGAISVRELERYQLEVRTRQAQVRTAEATVRVRASELETARAMLISPDQKVARKADDAASCCVDIRAPVNGRVLKVMQKSEAVVAAGTPLLEIGNLDDLEVVVDLLSSDAVRVQPSTDVLIERWGGGDLLHGRVRRVEPYGYTKVSALGIEEQRVDVIIDFTGQPEEWQSLGHGYRVEARIVVWRGEDVLRVPVSALFRQGGDWVTYVVDADNRARLRRVSVGHRNAEYAEIAAGLEEGERVVVYPSDRVIDGARVTARARDGA